MSARADLTSHVENFQRRILQDAVLEAESSYWYRRAETFETARTGLRDNVREFEDLDYAGRASPTALAARDARLEAIARACRARAAVALISAGHIDQVIEDTLLAGVTT